MKMCVVRTMRGQMTATPCLFADQIDCEHIGGYENRQQNYKRTNVPECKLIMTDRRRPLDAPSGH